MVKKLLVIALLVMLLLSGCSEQTWGSTEYMKQNIQAREEAFARAEAAIPQPIPQNFLARKMLAKYVQRQDVPSHLFYIYIVADTGNILGYYVAQAAPVNINAFLSPTEKIVRTADNSSEVLTAPSLDGIYYGGAGATSEGDGWFFFDAATDALIIIRGFKFFVSDYPLNLDAKPITVRTE